MESVRWVRYGGSPRFSYPIDYEVGVVDVDASQGRIDFLGRWSPNAYCHYHRHRGETVAAVLEGEQHIIESSEHETITKIRTAGFVGHVPDGETHMERAGSEGMTILFSVRCPDGRLFDVLDESGEVLACATIDEFVRLATLAEAENSAIEPEPSTGARHAN